MTLSYNRLPQAARAALHDAGSAVAIALGALDAVLDLAEAGTPLSREALLLARTARARAVRLAARMAGVTAGDFEAQLHVLRELGEG